MGGHDGHAETGGVKPMSLGGRLIHERERLAGMTDEERAWRKKWLLDQNLTPREPVYIPGDSKELLNPIRRAYKAPLNVVFFKFLQPLMGVEAATVFRFYTGKICLGVMGIYLTYYYFKYNTNNWERKGGWRIITSRTSVYPGEEGYPKIPEKTKGSDYCDRDFSKSIFAKKYAPKDEDQKCTPKFVF